MTKNKMLNILVVGAGYVGTSLATLLSKKNKVYLVDICKEKVNNINKRTAPIEDSMLQSIFDSEDLMLKAYDNLLFAPKKIDHYILALPTNYDANKDSFDTSILDNIIKEISYIDENASVIIKSTVPIGFTKSKNIEYPKLKLTFSPEFLREGTAVKDNLYPDRIVIGSSNNFSEEIGLMLASFAKNDPEIISIDSTAAEAVKLFSNTFLALRVAYFNELDSYCTSLGINSKDVIKAVCSDKRIGNHYNNPSFGFGGYCLPKDSLQLESNFKDIPQRLISAVTQSNKARKQFIANQIIKRKEKNIGIYRLVMKFGSDNIRESSILDILDLVSNSGVKISIFEPSIKEDRFRGFSITKNLKEFKSNSELIIANRVDQELDDVISKVFTSDIFGTD